MTRCTSSRSAVHQSYSLWREAVDKSVSSDLVTPELFSWWEQFKNCGEGGRVMIFSALPQQRLWGTRLFSLHQPSRMHCHVLAVLTTMDWVHSVEEIQCSAWCRWRCYFRHGQTEVSPPESPGSRDMWWCSGWAGGVSPFVSWGWWYWMLSWNQCTGFWHWCLSGPDGWGLSAKWWIIHPLWSGWDDKWTGVCHVM